MVSLSEKNKNNFIAKIRKTDTCWFWNGYKIKGGYGRFNVNGRATLAHRISWELWRSEIGSLNVLHNSKII